MADEKPDFEFDIEKDDAGLHDPFLTDLFLENEDGEENPFEVDVKALTEGAKRRPTTATPSDEDEDAYLTPQVDAAEQGRRQQLYDMAVRTANAEKASYAAICANKRSEVAQFDTNLAELDRIRARARAAKDTDAVYEADRAIAANTRGREAAAAEHDQARDAYMRTQPAAVAADATPAQAFLDKWKGALSYDWQQDRAGNTHLIPKNDAARRMNEISQELMDRGYNAGRPELYKELRKRMDAEFPGQFSSGASRATPRSAPRQTVATGGEGAGAVRRVGAGVKKGAVPQTYVTLMTKAGVNMRDPAVYNEYAEAYHATQRRMKANA